MVPYQGDFVQGQTVRIPFNAFSSDDPAASVTVTDLVAGDIKVHKNGGLTQRTSSAGITVSIDFDSITGNHYITIDTSDDTDSGFYAANADYEVRIEGATIDGGTINSFMATFSIENRVRSLPSKNVAFTFNFGMVDATDHVTEEPSLTITAQVSKDGGSFANVTGTVTEIANGEYELAASAADMNGDVLTFRFTATGAKPEKVRIYTLSAL